MKGRVSAIQQFSVNDGYGIRTIVFLAGCGMRCAWCQNPETIGSIPVLMFNPSQCEGCGECIRLCPTGAARAVRGVVTVERRGCIQCFACVERCFYNARSISHKTMTASEAFAVVSKDEAFFRHTGGGLTLSGGEPLLQSEFCAEMLRLAKEAGIHTAIETAGCVHYSAFIAVLPDTDLFLFDLKLLDEEKHKRWTGVSNAQILQNLERLCKTKQEVIIRVPLIPGVNDGEEFRAIAEYAAGLRPVKELHILPYHTLGSDKYTHLGIPYELEALEQENEEAVERCASLAESLGLLVSVGGAGF